MELFPRNCRTVLLVAVAAVIVVMLPGESRPVSAQSLWQKRDPRMAFLFQDLKPRHVGDMMTVVINEDTDVANSDSRGLNKQSGASADGGLSYDTTNSSGSASAQFNTNSKREFDGDANFSSDRQFLDRFSVTVVDVLPNGNFVISGSRNIYVEGDNRWLVLSGVVRDLDVRSDNSILSRDIANLEIKYVGNGPESKFINQGWFSRRVNKLWPF